MTDDLAKKRKKKHAFGIVILVSAVSVILVLAVLVVSNLLKKATPPPLDKGMPYGNYIIVNRSHALFPKDDGKQLEPIVYSDGRLSPINHSELCLVPVGSRLPTRVTWSDCVLNGSADKSRASKSWFLACCDNSGLAAIYNTEQQGYLTVKDTDDELWLRKETAYIWKIAKVADKQP